MSDNELMARVEAKIKRDLMNWEQLNDKQREELASMIVKSAFIKSSDKFAKQLLDVAIAIGSSKCPRCEAPVATGPPTCEICETIRRVNSKTESKPDV